LLLASESFDIDVTPEPVPEPGTVWLLAFGVAAMALARKERDGLRLMDTSPGH
jgi:hypothetical protein